MGIHETHSDCGSHAAKAVSAVMVAAIVVSIAIWMAGTMQEFSVAAWQDMAG